MATCNGKAKNGGPCTAPAQRGKPFCFHHDPNNAEARREASKVGGRIRAEGMDRRPPQSEVDRLPALKSAGDAKLTIEKVIRWVLLGSLDPRAANAVATCIRAFADLHRDEEIEEKLRELERAQGVAPAANGHAGHGVA